MFSSSKSKNSHAKIMQVGDNTKQKIHFLSN